MNTIKLQAHDGKIGQIETHKVKISTTISDLIDLNGLSTEVIPLPNVLRGDTLELIINFMNDYHQHVTCLPSEEDRNRLTQKDHERLYKEAKWLDSYLKGPVPHQTLSELVLMANYLDITPLLHVTCRQVADYCLGKDKKAIIDEFAIDPSV